MIDDNGDAPVPPESPLMSARLGDARRHRADADLRYQFHGDPGIWIGILEIEDQLG